MVAALLGWVGTFGTFAAYLLLWRGRLTSTSLTYSSLNAVGGTMGGIASALYGAWPSAASNLVWALLGLQSVGVILAERRAERRARRCAPVDAAGSTTTSSESSDAWCTAA